jgi:HEAT repeat protein
LATAACVWLVAACGVVAGDGAAAPAESRDAAAEKAVAQLLEQIKKGITGAPFRELDKRMEKFAPALRALGKDAVPSLRRRLQPGKEDIWAILALAWLGKDGEEAVPALITIATTQKKDEKWVHYRMFAMGAAMQIRPKWTKHLPFLLDALDDPLLHHSAMDVLEEIGPQGKDAVPSLVKRVKRNYPESYPPYMRTSPRLVAIVGGIGPAAKAAIPCLLDALRHEDDGVREEAAWALAQIGQQPKEVIPALRRALRDKDKRVRRRAANALGAFGLAAKSALPDLREAEKDPEWAVRLAAAVAIISIERPPGE